MTFELADVTFYLLVFVRLAACFMMNPIFSRSSLPSMARMGIVMLMVFIVAPNVGNAGLEALTTIELVALVVKEALIGAILGYVIQIFMYMLAFAGDMADMAFGLAMAKVMNPATEVQSGASGSIFTYLFILLLFATNGHLVMIRAFVYTFECIPLASFVNIVSLYQFIVTTFISAFNLAIRLFLPYVACEIVLEITLGILMKMIPQIHVFVINIQLKIILGIFILLMLCGSLGDFMSMYIDTSLNALQEAIISLSVDS